jgi:hypothetical protein
VKAGTSIGGHAAERRETDVFTDEEAKVFAVTVDHVSKRLERKRGSRKRVKSGGARGNGRVGAH